MTETVLEQQSPSPAGLGGWLVLVGLGLIITPLRLGTMLVQVFLPIFKGGVWEALTTPGSDAYDPLWAPLLIFEIVGNTFFIAAAVILLVLFFKRSRRFPKLYISFLVANLVFMVADAWLGSLVLIDQPVLDSETVRELGRSLLAGFIWIPYMLVSRRVRNTFVEQVSR